MMFCQENKSVHQIRSGISYSTRLAFLAGSLLLSLCAPLHATPNQDCLVCHGERSLTMDRRGKTIPLFVDAGALARSAHGELECVSCHKGLNPLDIPHARKIRPVDCGGCHGEKEIESYRQSIHARALSGGRIPASCVDCHTAHATQKLAVNDSTGRKRLALDMCTRCHGDVQSIYMDSDHGRALVAGAKGAPSCTDCHDEHGVLSPSAEGTHSSHTLEAAMCLRCHLHDPDVQARVGPSAGFISSYDNSVHARAIKRGNDSAATCSDCHGSHEMKKGSNPESKVAKRNIGATCGHCHDSIRLEYVGSIHGAALQRGIGSSATCTDCHGEHNILSPQDASSPVASGNVSAQDCSPCHASLKLTQKYGLASDRFQSFEDSYHGLANRAGSVEVANCASCHGVHDIKPSTDPTSRIHRSNLAKTCVTCQHRANDKFTKGSVHVTATSGSDEVLYLVSTAYVILITVIVGGMSIHNIADFIRKSRRQLMYRRGLLQRHPARHRLNGGRQLGLAGLLQ